MRKLIRTSQWSTGKKAVGATVAAAAIGAGSFLIANVSSASQSITASPDNPVYWLCQNKGTGAETTIRTYDGSGTYPACGSNYNKLWWNEQGPAGANGTNGANGTDAQMTVQGMTALTDRLDSARNGSNWATDQLTRTITLTRDHEVSASKCGAGATQCWAYFGTISDQGTFKTISGATSPEAGNPIAGTLSGTVTGSVQFEVDASSDTPAAANLPTSQSGNTVATADMIKQLFKDGTQFSSVTEPVFGYDYVVTSGTCEQWHDGSAGDTGDIDGTNHCTA